MVGQDPHRWAPSKGSVLFSYLWQKFLNIRFPWFPLPSQGEPFKNEEKRFGYFKICLYICNVKKRQRHSRSLQ